jgi:outer membrane autotransporter protein
MREFMLLLRRTGIASCLVALSVLMGCQLASAETLADIDAEIQTNKTIQAHRTGLDAYNIYDGVTNARLDRKIAILKTTSVNSRFYQRWDSGLGAYVAVYDNFYSYTSTVGVTDTKLDLLTTTTVQRLYRRGAGATSEINRGYFGAWWGDKYRGIQASRDEQAILAAWGSDLNRIYVIDMPAGYTLVGGVAAPMEKDGEYRMGGAYQYYYSGVLSTMMGWLVYALYAPDYLKSYSGAVSSAQQTGRSVANDLGLHLNQTRYAGRRFSEGGDSGDAVKLRQVEQEGEFWLRGFAGNSNFVESDNIAVSSQTGSLSLGWQRLTSGGKPVDKSRTYFGLMAATSNTLQKYASNVENRTQATLGGIYGLYVNRPDSTRSWYGQWSLLHGGLTFNNTVPGELGYGLKQDYNGNITVLTLENGVSLRQKHGWILEPQLQLSYTKVGQNDFTDKLGALVSLKQGESFRGRLGMVARRTIEDSSQRRSSFWAKLSYLQQLSGRNEVDVAGDQAVSEANRSSWQLGLGADMQLSRQWILQGEVTQLFGGETGFQGNLAVKLVW